MQTSHAVVDQDEAQESRLAPVSPIFVLLIGSKSNLKTGWDARAVSFGPLSSR